MLHLCRKTLRFHSQFRVNLERTPHQKHLNVSLELKSIENPERKAISALKKKTNSGFNEAAKLLVFTVGTSGSLFQALRWWGRRERKKHAIALSQFSGPDYFGAWNRLRTG